MLAKWLYGGIRQEQGVAKLGFGEEGKWTGIERKNARQAMRERETKRKENEREREN